MNKRLSSALLLIALSLLAVAGLSAPVQAQRGVLGEILHRMDEHNKSLVSLKADVRMEKFNSQLGETDTTMGTTSYLPRKTKGIMAVRIDWSKPIEEHIVILGDTYKLYRPRLNQVITGKVDSVQKDKNVPGNALAFMSMSQEQLRANYEVNYIGEESNTWHLELIPKTRTSYKSAELWVDSNGMPIQAKVIEQNNDTTTVKLSNLQKNVTINVAEFQLSLPKGVKQIQG